MDAVQSPVVCPFCDATVPEADLVAGWCDGCGKHLPAWLIDHLPYNRTHHTRTHGGPDSSPANPVLTGHTCALCGETTADAQLCFLRPTRRVRAAAPAGKPANVRCWVCAACHDRGREIRSNHLIVMGWAAASVVAAAAAAVVIAALDAGWFLYPFVGVLLLANLAACAVYLRYVPARQVGPWLGRLDPVLRSAYGVSGWGDAASMRVAQEVPEGESFVDAEDLMKSADHEPSYPARHQEPIGRPVSASPA